MLFKHRNLVMIGGYKCSLCGKDLSSYYVLRGHYQKFHADHPLPDKRRGSRSQPSFSCIYCSKAFSHRSTLARHRKLMHRDLVGNLPCPACSKSFTRRIAVLNHIKEEHSNQASCIIEKKFSSMNDFKDWLQKEEKRSSSRYVKSSGLKTLIYLCHRSGKYISKGKGLRQSKAETTCKIGYLCSSFISLQCSEGSYSMTFQSLHNHGPETQQMTVGKKKKSKKDTLSHLISEAKHECDSLLNKLQALGNSRGNKSLLKTVVSKLKECNSYVDVDTCDELHSCKPVTDSQMHKLARSPKGKECQMSHKEQISRLSEEREIFIVNGILELEDHQYSKIEISEPT